MKTIHSKWLAPFLALLMACGGGGAQNQPNAPVNVPDSKSYERWIPFVGQGGLYGFLNEKGDTVKQAQLDVDAAFAFDKGLGRVVVGGQYGFMNRNGEITIKPAYAAAKDFANGLAPVLFDADKGLWGYIDETGAKKIDPIFEYASEFSGGAAVVSIDGKRHLLKNNGQLKELPYEEVFDYREGLALAKNENLYFFIDANGAKAFDKVFAYGRYFSEGKAAVQDTASKLFGYINHKGQYIIEPQFERARPFSYGVAPVAEKGQWGYIDSVGHFFVEPQFADAESFENGVALVMTTDNHLAYVNLKKDNVIPNLDAGVDFVFSKINEGLVRYEHKGKWGFLNPNAEFIVHPDYQDVAYFHDGSAPVLAQEGGKEKAGFINKKSQWIIKPKFDNAWPFYEGKAVVAVGEKWGVIDPTGNYLVPPKFERAASRFSEGLLAVREKGKWGFVNAKGEWVIPAKYYGVGTNFERGRAIVLKKEKGEPYVINRKNEKISGKD